MFFCGNQSRTCGGGGGEVRALNMGKGAKRGCGSIIQSKSKKDTKTFPKFLLTFETINYPAFPYDVSNITCTVYYPSLSAHVDSRANSLPPIDRR